ncbi:MAG: hypothetical protein Q8M06_09945 [Methanobacteriaceae archaeon]|nr:hypothetical protein [Methanobacteriaceae archaeon]
MDTNYSHQKELTNMSLRRLLRLNEELEELKYYGEKGVPILIEGKKDEKALRELGINGFFIKVSGSPLNLFEIAEIAAESSPNVIILTDFDKKGNQLAKKLSNDIQSLGSCPEMKIRRRIMGMTRKYIKDIESLPKHINKLRIDVYPYGCCW